MGTQSSTSSKSTPITRRPRMKREEVDAKVMGYVENIFINADYPVEPMEMIMEDIVRELRVSRSAVHRLYQSTYGFQETVLARLVHHNFYQLERIPQMAANATEEGFLVPSHMRHTHTVGLFGSELVEQVNHGAITRLTGCIETCFEDQDRREEVLGVLNHQHTQYLDAVMSALRDIAIACGRSFNEHHRTSYASAFTALAHGFDMISHGPKPVLAFAAIADTYTHPL